VSGITFTIVLARELLNLGPVRHADLSKIKGHGGAASGNKLSLFLDLQRIQGPAFCYEGGCGAAGLKAGETSGSISSLRRKEGGLRQGAKRGAAVQALASIHPLATRNARQLMLRIRPDGIWNIFLQL
jgi:hypothetical protein